jgi:hypothetical protein
MWSSAALGFLHMFAQDARVWARRLQLAAARLGRRELRSGMRRIRVRILKTQNEAMQFDEAPV